MKTTADFAKALNELRDSRTPVRVGVARYNILFPAAPFVHPGEVDTDCFVTECLSCAFFVDEVASIELRSLGGVQVQVVLLK